MKIFMITIMYFASLIFARIHCENLDKYGYGSLTKNAQQQLVNNLKQELEAEYRNECVTKGGEGSAFTIHPGRVVTDCAEYSGSTSGYLRVEVLCDYCTGEKVDKILDLVEKYCNDECMASIAYCQKADLIYEGGWGGTVENYDKCGETLSECQSEGSSSSVGEEEQSSSSQEQLSSDSQYSSFEAESSSSEEYDPESSGSSIKSSSSDDGGGNPSSSSGIGERGTQCYIGDEESCHPWSGIILFKRRPVVLGEIKLYGQQPYCREDGNIVFRAGIPIAYFRASSWLCLKEDCISYHSIEGSWECNEGSVQNNGCSAEPEHRSLPFYYSVQTGNLIASWGLKVDFSSTPESGMNLAYFDVNDLLNIVAREGVYVDGDDGLSYDLTDLYPQFSGNSFDDYVRACAYHLNIDVSSSSEVGSSSSSSSLFVLASSSSVQSSSSEESSSSVEESSSSYECSSSDCGDDISSSSQEEFSSSSDELVSSGSVDVEESSSSQQMESSSSEFVYSSSSDGHFVSGGDQVHSPDQIFNDGLDNMEPGSCYSLNPDRGTQYGWMNTDAKDSWWWREVDCESGEKVDRNRVGVCPGFPLDKVPSNPKRSCVAYDGRCYRCKSENSYVDCSQEWLWKWSFNVQNIGTWYAEVDCYNPFEDDDNDGLCPDGNVLMKTATVINNMEKINYNDISADYLSVVKFYDVLGRRFNGNRSKFLKTFKKQEKKIERVKVTAFDVGSVIYIPIEDLGLSRNYLAKEGQTCQPYSCGNIGKDYGVNGDVGVYCGYPCTELIEEKGHLRIEISNKMRTGSCGENKSKYTITFKLPAKTTIKRKNVYYVVPIGHKIGNNIVTEDDYNAGKRHEIGHMESYSCLEKNKMFKSEYVFVLEDVCEDEFICNKKGVIKGLADSISKSITGQRDTAMNELVEYNKNLWQKMCGWYHKTFSRYDGPGGSNNPQKVECPTTDTLLEGKYDLAGCEVIE